jgi:hypothetical protein
MDLLIPCAPPRDRTGHPAARPAGRSPART